MKKSIILSLMVLFCLDLRAQSELDALRFGYILPMGSTARSIGVAGAMGGIGADGASLFTNPAGLARFRKNNYSITGGINTLNHSSTYINANAIPTRQTNYALNGVNLNFVSIARERGVPRKEGWLNHNFSLGYQQSANFNRTYRYEGQNSNNSYLDAVANMVNDLGLSIVDLETELNPFRDGFDYYENMFWEGVLIDYNESSNSFFPVYRASNPDFIQFGNVTTTGSIQDYALAYSGNYNNKLLIGIGLNISRVRFTEKNVYSEDYLSQPEPEGWTWFDFTRNLETSGTGFSANIGLMYQHTKALRFGLNIETPRVLRLTDNYWDGLQAGYADGFKIDYFTIDKEFSYRVTTPSKIALQAGYVINKNGFLSGELQIVNYGSMSLNSEFDQFLGVNNIILNDFRTAANIRIGVEQAFGDFRIRGGFASMSNPMYDGEMRSNFLSFGGGFTDGKIIIDFGMNFNFVKDQYAPYVMPGGPLIDNNYRRTSAVVTIGRRIL